MTKYCDECEKVMRLTEDGYCRGCGKHADNMKARAIPQADGDCGVREFNNEGYDNNN